MPSDLLGRLAAGEILICDGATGTMLYAGGCGLGDCPEAWALDHDEVLRAVHRAYIASGADVNLTSTIGGNALKLDKYGLGNQTRAISRGHAELVGEVIAAEAAAAGRPLYLAGDIGPTGEFMAPIGALTEEELSAAFLPQVQGLVEGGADLIYIETMIDVREAVVAVQTTRQVCDLPIIASMSFNPGRAGFRTVMGDTPARAVEALLGAGADVVGSNCGAVLAAQMPDLVRAFIAAGARWVAIEPNAGLPQLVEERTVFAQSPEEMAAAVPAILEAGAQLIGGCCGTTPEHIRQIALAVHEAGG